MKSRGGAALLVAITLTGALAGCGGGTDTSAKPANATSTDGTSTGSASSEPRESKVKLLDPGAEPRSPIRLQLTAGDVQRTSMRMQTSVAMTVDGRSAPTGETPPIVMGMQVKVAKIRPDGVIETTFSYDSLKAEGTGADAKQIESAMKGILGVTGTLEITANGEYVDGGLDIPSGMDPKLETTLKSIETQMNNLAVPLPLEDVGIGAVWTVTSQAAVNGIESNNVYRFKLVERSAHGVVLETTVTGTAPQQDPQLPGLPAGSVHLDQLALSGAGRSTIDLGHLLPVSSSTSTTGDVRMTITAEGSTSKLVQKLKTQVDVGSP